MQWQAQAQARARGRGREPGAGIARRPDRPAMVPALGPANGHTRCNDGLHTPGPGRLQTVDSASGQ
jgi:hypothetical protein